MLEDSRNNSPMVGWQTLSYISGAILFVIGGINKRIIEYIFDSPTTLLLQKINIHALVFIFVLTVLFNFRVAQTRSVQDFSLTEAISFVWIEVKIILSTIPVIGILFKTTEEKEPQQKVFNEDIRKSYRKD